MDAIAPLNIRFWAQASINKLNNERLLKKMFNAGCRVVFVGFESVSQESLDSVNKGIVNNATKFKEAINRIHSSGIGVFGSFVLGLETDNTDIFEKTARFIEDTAIAFSAVNVLTPLVGTRLFAKYENSNRLLNKDWENYTVEKVCIKPTLMSLKELENGREWLLHKTCSYSSFYRRLKKVWSMGAFVRQRQNKGELFSKGRILITLILISRNIKRTWFTLKSLWNSRVTSITCVLLALNFHDYAYSNKRISTKVASRKDE